MMHTSEDAHIEFESWRRVERNEEGDDLVNRPNLKHYLCHFLILKFWTDYFL